MVIDVRHDLTRALAGLDEFWAREVANPVSRVQGVPVSFLTRHRIVRVECLSPSRPSVFYVGYVPGGRAHVLAGRPEAFLRICQADGALVASRHVASEYAALYLDATQPFGEPFSILTSVEDLRFAPRRSAEDESTRMAALIAYQDVIRPPTARLDGSAFAVTIYTIRGRCLERHELSVSRDGDIRDAATVLVEDLPVEGETPARRWQPGVT